MKRASKLGHLSVEEDETLPPIVFYDLDDLKMLGRFPRSPENKVLQNKLVDIDRNDAGFIFLSHCWLRRQPRLSTQSPLLGQARAPAPRRYTLREVSRMMRWGSAAVRGAACALGPPCRPHARPERHLTRPAVVGFPCRTKGFHGRTKGFHGRTKGRYVPKRPVPRSVQGEERLRCRNSFCQFSRRTCCTTFSPRQSSSSTSSWAGSSGGPRPPKNKMARGRASCPPAIPPGR